MHKNVLTLDDISNIPQIDPDQIEPGAKFQILVTQGDKIYRIESTSIETKAKVGPTGPTGPKGDPGINIVGSGGSEILDPNYHGNIGDAQIITTEDGETKIYIWNGTEWEELEIKGVTGPTGPMGPLGLQGPLGPKGDPGVNITGTVGSVDDLDPDYDGEIGVPIGILDYLCKDQFTITGMLCSGSGDIDKAKPIIKGQHLYSRVLIKKTHKQ